MTEKQKEIIKNNLYAFEHNCGKVSIEKYGKDFYVYYPEDNPQYMQICPSIDYLNGWLYGCVQGVLRVQYMKKGE